LPRDAARCKLRLNRKKGSPAVSALQWTLLIYGIACVVAAVILISLYFDGRREERDSRRNLDRLLVDLRPPAGDNVIHVDFRREA
jgi:hypothetical protein